MVMVAPAIRYLLDQHPDAEMTLVTSPDGQRLFRDFHPRLSEIRVFRTSNPGRRLSRISLAHWLRQHTFDVKYCLETDERHHRILGATPGTTIVMTPESASKDTHYSLGCLRLVGHPDPVDFLRNTGTLIPVSTEGRELANTLLGKLGVTPTDRLVALHPTFSATGRRWRNTAKRYKHWPAECWARLAEELYAWGDRNSTPVKVMIDVLPEDAHIAHGIARLCKREILMSCEPPNFSRYKAIVRRADLFVAPDTGTMHLAAGLGTPLVALYAGTDPAACGPFSAQYGRATVLRTTIANEALSAITVDTAVRACIEMISLSTNNTSRCSSHYRSLGNNGIS
jgi:ADP-heptose:LPS heptosyltransferase